MAFSTNERMIFGKGVGCVVIKDNKVLLGRHNYGRGNGLLIIPGGFINEGELPAEAAAREVLEETNVVVKPMEIVSMRFSSDDWYLAFRAEYISGEARINDEENSEVIWLDVEETLNRKDVPPLTKEAIKSCLKFTNSKEKYAMSIKEDYDASREVGPYAYYD
ncbi:NUDIX domain-containing protein [uncultured Brachyspira sp.]|uniref:NUDIX domain-containing protein n=1 Tax=uncultured Brachyspira sp. TaxID=221953 RepID=UPI002624087C|nr:NUDIX hydrolase [uncultured Brachyspira sp.]